jgi:hypothetical protein
MKFPLSFILLSALSAGAASAQTVSLDFSSLGTSLVSFQGTGSTLAFTPDAATGFDFQIANSSIAGLNGLDGSITGTFTIGAISTGPGGIETAPVSGVGQFSIYDGSSADLTARIWWDSAFTFGSSGSLNPTAASNIGQLSYTGTDAALETLASQTSGTTAVTFQFLPPESLEQLTAPGAANSTTYSGSLVAVPEPSAWAAWAAAAAFVGAMAGRRPGRLGALVQDAV